MSDLNQYVSALQFAIQKHDDAKQTREDKITPYWVHPVRVAELLRQAGVNNYDILSAALLHDVIEDTDTTAEELTEHFGKHVSDLVCYVSQLDKENFSQYLNQLADAPNEAKMIKLADRANNLNELRTVKYATYGGKSPEKYIEDSEKIVEVCRLGNSQLVKLLEEEIRFAGNEFKEK